MIEGVEVLHKNNLIHRDLKLDNILIQSDMNIVVCDFGLVVECKDENGNDKKINQFAGTVSTMSPQAQMIEGQSCASEYGLETDWWSIGIVLYQLMYLRNPFEVKDNSQDLTPEEKEVPATPEETKKLKEEKKQTDGEDKIKEKINNWRFIERKQKELIRRVKGEGDDGFPITEAKDDEQTYDEKSTQIRVDWDTKDKQDRYGQNEDDIYSPELRSLVARLLKRIPEERLGYGPKGHEAILKDEAFKLLKNKDGSPDDKEEGFIFQTPKLYDLSRDFDKLKKLAKDAIDAKNEKKDVTNVDQVKNKLEEFDEAFADLFAKEEPKKETEADAEQIAEGEEKQEASQSGLNSTVANSAAENTQALSQGGVPN